MIVDMQPLIQIIPIPAFKDNYIWLIHDGSQAIVIDPGDAEPVIHTLNELRLTLHAILVTHHHQDHVGGVNALAKKYTGVNIFAPKLEQFYFAHTQVCEPNKINLTPFAIKIAVLDIPGHTLGHIAYYMTQGDQHWLFCGDTLFGAGCGRLFEGSPEQMLNSLQKLAALPAETQVYCAHEYTLNNIDFALTLEPNNAALIDRQHYTLELRRQLKPSLPSTLALERTTNPFLRCDSQEIISALSLQSAPLLQVFSTIRELKNHY